MTLVSLDHCSIRTAKLHETCEFFVDIIGLEVGFRPEFPFPGEFLYLGDQAVIHLVGIDKEDTSGLINTLGGETDPEKLDGSGAIDHIAFRANNIEQMLKKLDENDFSYFQRKVTGMDLFQIFLKDPNGITIELNYWKK